MIRVRLSRIASLPAMLCLALAGVAALAQEEQAVTRRQAELRETPAPGARSVASVPPQTQVVRTQERQGAWVQVRTANGTSGWMHMFDLGAVAGASAPAAANPATGALRGVTSLFRGSGGPSTSGTSTIGIRGLGAEDIANAQPNVEAVGRMEALRLSEAQARQFAAEAPLSAVNVPSLAAPPRSTTTPNTGPLQ